MRYRQILFAALACCLSGCDAAKHVVGPCFPTKTKGSSDAYLSLSLNIVYPKIGRVADYPLRSEEDRLGRFLTIDTARHNEIPAIEDACLRDNAERWADWYEKKVTDMRVGGYDTSGYDERKAKKDDEVRELARNLGLVK